MSIEKHSSPSAAEAAAKAVEASLRAAGIGIFGLVGEEVLRDACSGLTGDALTRYGIDRARSAVAAALPYGEGPTDVPEWARGMPGPLARIARFARANWYAELSARLRSAAVLARAALAAAGLDPGRARDWRCLSNSGLPERRLAVEAALGSPGRHGLVMVPGHGSAVVLGLLLIPVAIADRRIGLGGAPLIGGGAEPTRDAHRRISSSCESCGACVAACPTGALRGGSFARELCLQHWSSIRGALPREIEAAWGDRLYGCDACQEACPLFAPDPSARTERGLLGPGLPAPYVAEAPPGELRERLRGSALGMGWIPLDALARNARLALSSRFDSGRSIA
jgi:epoxyqueuosine reductase